MKYGKDLSFPKGWRGRAGEPGFPAKKYSPDSQLKLFSFYSI